MRPDPHPDSRPFHEAIAALRLIWREAGGFFLSIELWMMVLLSWLTVGGFWLAFTGDPLAIPVFGAAVAYVVVRLRLHVKGVLAWPFV